MIKFLSIRVSSGILRHAGRLGVLLLLHLIASGIAAAEEKTCTLQEAYEAALGNYETVRIAEEGLIQSERVVDQAWTYLYPRLSGSATYTRYNKILPPNAPAGQIFQPKEDLTGALVLTQPIYTGGRTLAALRAAKDMREASRRDLSAARQDLLLNVAAAYYGVLKAQKLVEVSRDSLERMERNRQVTEREAGLRRTKANASALLRANTLVSSAKIMLVQSEEGLRVARRNLSLLTGLPENVPLAEPPEMNAPPEGYEPLLENALANRDDYARARLNLEIAGENVAIVRGSHLPQLSAEGGLQRKNTDPATIMEGTTYYGSIKLNVPIFEGGLMNAEVAEAKSKLRQSEFAVSLLRRSIEGEVYESYTGLQSASTVLALAKQQYDDAKQNFQKVEELYAAGLASSLQLIDAQQALLLSEREYVNLRFDQQVAILKLQRAIGMLDREAGGRETGAGNKEKQHAAS